MEKKQYGLCTAITMIVGVVIGSGIFFKSDNILNATNGNVLLGVLLFSLAAISIIFGSLTIAQLASRNDTAGGIITYAEDAYNGGIACAFGWFHTLLYYPTLIAVVSWVTGIYTCMLFNLNPSLETEVFIGLIVILFLFTMNILSSKIGGYFQNLSTVIKLIPLIVIAIVGLLLGDSFFITNPRFNEASESLVWISAIAPIAFSFDGWIVSTSIAHEVKNAKRNVPLALIFAPLFILAIYLLYFIGISLYIGPEQIIALKDAHVNVAAQLIFGANGAKVILIFVIISVLGTVNGLIMGITRLPYSLAVRNMFPKSEYIAATSKTDFPIRSSLIGLGVSIFWMAIHYLTQKFTLLPGSDVSEISITINYVCYILLYIRVLKDGLKGEISGIWQGKINPIMAIIGSLMILLGSIFSPMFWFYTVISATLMTSAVLFWKSQHMG